MEKAGRRQDPEDPSAWLANQTGCRCTIFFPPGFFPSQAINFDARKTLYDTFFFFFTKQTMLYSIDGRPAHDAMTTDGFVIIDNLIKPELLEPLREAAARVIKKARDGEWKER